MLLFLFENAASLKTIAKKEEEEIIIFIEFYFSVDFWFKNKSEI